MRGRQKELRRVLQERRTTSSDEPLNAKLRFIVTENAVVSIFRPLRACADINTHIWQRIVSIAMTQESLISGHFDNSSIDQLLLQVWLSVFVVRILTWLYEVLHIASSMEAIRSSIMVPMRCSITGRPQY